MENDIIDALNDIGYEGPLSNEVAFSKALDGGPKSLEYTKLIHILAAEIKDLLGLEETVNMMNDPSESNTFLLELSSFLKELGCPYKKLVTGYMSSRLQTSEDRLLLLDYLISELMAARMVKIDKPKDNNAMEIVMQESPTAKDMKDILISLKFNKPPPNITLEVLFAKLEAKLKDTIQKEGDKLVGKPLYNKSLNETQWRELQYNYLEMLKEYKLRRETLITRLECTISSFEWSDRLKSKKDDIEAVYRPRRALLKARPGVTLYHFLAARTSLLRVEKTSHCAVSSDVSKIIIGRVPDRGGRPHEQQPPPPEMPSWQLRSAPSGGGGGRGGRGGVGGGGGGGGARVGGGGAPRGGGGGGGRVQGGYNQGSGDQGRPQSSSAQYTPHRNHQTFEVPPGGYSQNQGNYNHNRGSYNQSQAGYSQNQGGYNQNQGGYSQNQGGYNHNQGGYNQNRGGYQGYQSRGGYNQGSDNSGGYNQGYQGGGHRGGYQNEHDDRDRRGRSTYNRGGRR